MAALPLSGILTSPVRAKNSNERLFGDSLMRSILEKPVVQSLKVTDSWPAQPSSWGGACGPIRQFPHYKKVAQCPHSDAAAFPHLFVAVSEE